MFKSLRLHLNNLKRTLQFLPLLVLLHTLPLFSQLDSDGWTIMNPANAETIIYVSSSDGNDNEGIPYRFPNTRIGNDPILPIGGIKPFKTIKAAEASVSSSSATWILLKRGDVFTSGIKPVSGKSKNKPLVYYSYGSVAKTPLLTTGDKAGVSFTKGSLSHVRIVGLSFYAQTRDPSNPAYVGTAGEQGFVLQTNSEGAINDILLEGNRWSFYVGNILQSADGSEVVQDIIIRRNIILDDYFIGGVNESVGIFGKGINGMLLEENIFDHNGWLIPSFGNSDGKDKRQGQATIYSHNTYFVNTKNIVFQKNSFNRPSSIANKWVAKKGPASTENITVKDNFYNDFEIMVSMGNNAPGDSYRFKNINIANNVAVHVGRTGPTRRSTAWGITLNDWDKGRFTDNIIAQRDNADKSGLGISIDGETRDVVLADNIFYDLQNSKGFRVRKEGSYDRLEVKNNKLTFLNNFKSYVEFESSDLNGFVFSGNTYAVPESFKRPFQIGADKLTFAQWEARTEVGNITNGSPEYPDPNRNLDTYVTNVLGLANIAAYYKELREQSYFNWRTAYTGEAIANWIRIGFLGETDSVPDDETSAEYRFLKFVPLGSVGIEPYIRELNWFINDDEYPNEKLSRNSIEVNASVNNRLAYKAYDGKMEGGWPVSNDFPQSITLELDETLDVLPERLEINVNGKRRNLSGFECWYSEDGVNFEKFYQTSGLTVLDYTGLTTTFDLSGNSSAILSDNEMPNSPPTTTDFMVYPNPGRDRIYFNKKTTVTIYDQSGQKIKTFDTVESIDVSFLSAGLYIVKDADGVSEQLIIE